MDDLFTAGDLAAIARLGIDPAEAVLVTSSSHAPAGVRPLSPGRARGRRGRASRRGRHRELLALYETAERRAGS